MALVDDGIQPPTSRCASSACGSSAARTRPRRARARGRRRAQVGRATGDGPVDATFKAIREIYPHEAGLPLFQIHAVTEGTDAQAEVTVRLEEDGKTVNGQAADTDTLVASARPMSPRSTSC